MNLPNTDRQNILYLYDLPKKQISSVQLAKYLKEKASVDLTRQPQIRRDPNKPFYTAMISIQNKEEFERASEALRYFNFDNDDDMPCRALPHDNELMGQNAQRLSEQNIFVRRIPKHIKAPELDKTFSKFGKIKSLKISLNPDYSSRGYGFVCFNDKNDASKALELTRESDEFQGVQFKPKDRREIRKAFNNIYVKNLPEDQSDEEIRKLFEPFGRIESIKLSANDKGKYAFVCYCAEDKNDREYGPKCAMDAVEKLNGMEIGDRKLYVKEALKKEYRQLERARETIKYKNSKKRCNLYVKGFSESATKEELEKLFSQYGEIESLRLFPANEQKKPFCFVCFKTPDKANRAKQELSNTTFGDKSLKINHYEIKEIRELNQESQKDYQDFLQHRQENQSSSLEQASPQEMLNCLVQIIQQNPQLLYTNRGMPRMNQNPRQPQYNNKMRMQNNNQRIPMQGMGHMQNQGRQHPHGPQGQMPTHGAPQGQMSGMPASQPGLPAPQSNMPQSQPGMPAPSQMPTPSQMPAPGSMPAPGLSQQQQPNLPAPIASNQSAKHQEYLQKTYQVLPGVTEANPFYKNQVGTTIFNYVVELTGHSRAPKITGMIIDLPCPNIQQILSNYDNLVQKVREAQELLDQDTTEPTPSQ